jgi:hypothetical protein
VSDVVYSIPGVAYYFVSVLRIFIASLLPANVFAIDEFNDVPKKKTVTRRWAALFQMLLQAAYYTGVLHDVSVTSIKNTGSEVQFRTLSLSAA